MFVSALLAAAALAAQAPVAPAPAPAEVAAAPAPAVAPDEAVRGLTERYFAALDTGDYAAAYALADPAMHGDTPLEAWAAARRVERTADGLPGLTRVIGLTWYQDPPGAPPGRYAAVDYARTAENLAFDCGYVIWRAEADGGFQMLRHERSFGSAADAARAGPEQLAAAKARAGCPAEP
jgi:hypothetical protein